jgi:hypothetical protein
MKKQIKERVGLELPIMHSMLIKKYGGLNNIVNKFIFIPDIVNNDNEAELACVRKITESINNDLISNDIKYDLTGFSFDKSMNLIFEYLFEDLSSGLCSTAFLIEDPKGWSVKKIDKFWSL